MNYETVKNFFMEVVSNPDPYNISLLVTIILVIVAFVIYVLRRHGLDKVRDKAHELFLKAEHVYLESGAGEEKMNMVVREIYAILPPIVRLFTTEKMIRNLLQKWFKSIKDLLDDGKNNDSAKLLCEEEEV